MLHNNIISPCLTYHTPNSFASYKYIILLRHRRSSIGRRGMGIFAGALIIIASASSIFYNLYFPFQQQRDKKNEEEEEESNRQKGTKISMDAK